MKDLSYWLDIPYIPRSALSGNISTDVVIIGGGISGVSAAYHCAKQGLQTVLIEKDAIASGSAGKNGGMVVEGFSIDFAEAAERFGVEETKESWLRTVEARKTVQSLIQEHNIDCDFEQPGSLYVSRTGEEAAWLRQEAATRQAAGIACELVEPGTHMRQSPFGLALYNPCDCLLHPVKFVRSLAQTAEKLGAIIYENTAAVTWTTKSVTTPNGTIKADRVVLAIESATENLLPEQGEVIREQALVTEPLSEEEFADLDWRTGGMFWTSGRDYYTIRRIGSRLFISDGVSLDATEAELKQHEQKLIDLIHQSFPVLKRADIRTSHRWNGLLLMTARSRPYIGTRNGVYEIFGHGGNGLTNGILAGKLLAEHFGGADIPQLYQFDKQAMRD